MVDFGGIGPVGQPIGLHMKKDTGFGQLSPRRVQVRGLFSFWVRNNKAFLIKTSFKVLFCAQAAPHMDSHS